MQRTSKQTSVKRFCHRQIDRASYERLFKQLANELEFKKANSPFVTNVEHERLSELANLIAMNSLKSSEFEKCEKYLKRADRYNRHSPRMLLVTHNNWSCYYKKVNNLKMALAHINKAIKIAQQIEESSKKLKKSVKVKLLADCFLNLCAILSSLGDHTEALHYVELAIERFEDDLRQTMLDDDGKEQSSNLADRQNVLAIAQYNRATELEHLKRTDAAQEQYRSLKQYLLNHFGQDHPLLSQVSNAIRTNAITTMRVRRRSEATNTRHFFSVNTEESKLPAVLGERCTNPLALHRLSLCEGIIKKQIEERQPVTLNTQRNHSSKLIIRRRSNSSMKENPQSGLLKLL